MPTSTASNSSPADTVREILRVTARAWGVAPESPQAVARRAPHGYEPLRRQRRRFFDAAKALAQQPLMAHSW
jgi:hypothetical protein